MYRVIKYGAKWCSQCRQQEKEFEKNPLNAAYHSIDVDDLSDKEIEDLKIKSIPVTIIWNDDNGACQELKRWVGFVKSEEVNKWL